VGWGRRDDGDRCGGRERESIARFAGLDATIVSEEAGVRGDGMTHVVVDPIDGSLNAKRGIGSSAVSIAVASGRDDGRRRLRLRARLRNR